MPKMLDSDLKAILDAKIQNALGFMGGRLSKAREDADRFYAGDPLGNELPGRSQVVSRDVAEAVDSMMPALMKIFTSGDQVVRFDPQGPEDEEVAKQATDYVNWIWTQQNEGFSVFYTWFKDALLKKTALIKQWWDETEEVEQETYQGLTDVEYQMLFVAPDGTPDGGVEEVEHAEYPGPDGMRHDVKLKRTSRDGRVRICPVPPDEFLIDRRAISLDDTPYCAHRLKRTVSQLCEMYPEKKGEIKALGDDDTGDFTPERIQRFRAEDDMPDRGESPMDPAMRELWVVESYIRVDYDGDGVAELRKVTSVGATGAASSVILDNEEVDDNPFAAITPVPMPHKFFGMSIADQTMDLQLIKSTLWRGALDSVYLANAPMVGAVEGQVNIDDLINRRPGGVVRMKAADGIVPLPSTPVAGDAYTMIAYVDGVREQRTGVQRFAPGPGADALNNAYTDTATGASIVETASQERLELIARTFAETGVKRAFRRTLELVCKHQQKPKIIRLRNKWVQMDPREWSNRMDMTVTVGLGTGNKTTQVAILSNLLAMDQKIIELQGGLAGPLVTAKNVYNKLAKLVEASGLKSVEAYYTDPDENPMPPQEPPPDPKVEQARALVAIKAEESRQQMALSQQEAAQDAMIERMKAAAEIEIERMKAAAKIEVERMLAAAKQQTMAREVELKAASGAYAPRPGGDA